MVDKSPFTPFDTFESRLDYALSCYRKTNAEFAALLGPNGQQTVRNWRSRGRIGHMSWRTIWQHLPGFPVQWINDHVGDTPTMEHHRLAEESNSYRVSQLQRPDPQILVQTQVFLDQAFAESGKEFRLVRDPDLFADAYAWLAEDVRPTDQRNLVDFVRWRASRDQANLARGIDEQQVDRSTTAEAPRANRGRAAS